MQPRCSGSWVSRIPCPEIETLCRYVGMISPGITISNHRLRWVVDGMRFTAPPHLMTIPVRKKFYICSDVSHTHTAKKNILQSWKTMVPVFWSVVFIAHDSHHQGFVKVRATQLRAIGGKYPQQTRFAEIQAMTKKIKDSFPHVSKKCTYQLTNSIITSSACKFCGIWSGLAARSIALHFLCAAVETLKDAIFNG